MSDSIIGDVVAAGIGLAIIGGVANAVKPRRTVYVRSRPRYKRKITKRTYVRRRTNPLNFKLGGGL